MEDKKESTKEPTNAKDIKQIILNQIERINAQAKTEVYNDVLNFNSLTQSVKVLECIVIALMSKEELNEYMSSLDEDKARGINRMEKTQIVFEKYQKLLVYCKQLGILEVDTYGLATN